MSLEHIQRGDKIAVRNKTTVWTKPSHPTVEFSIYDVRSRTATQLVAKKPGGEIKVRIKDGKVIGLDYTMAIEATTEILAKHEEQKQLADRWWKAQTDLNAGIFSKPLHQMELSLEQMEALAEAWTKIKAMAA